MLHVFGEVVAGYHCTDWQREQRLRQGESQPEARRPDCSLQLGSDLALRIGFKIPKELVPGRPRKCPQMGVPQYPGSTACAPRWAHFYIPFCPAALPAPGNHDGT